jgi:hypothetical protein
MPANEVLHEHRRPIEGAARAGYVARGAVYLIIGYFAFKAAYSTGRAMGSKEAITTIFGSFGGVMLLAVLVLALLAFSLWRFLQAGLDADRHGTGPKGLLVRAGLVVSGVSYGALAVFASTLAVGAGSSGGDGMMHDGISMAFNAGFGRALTLVAAVVMAGAGIALVIKGATAGFEKYMRFPAGRTWLKPVCQFGLIARGATFLLLGFLIFTGAVSYAEGETPGLGTALDAMADWRFGWVYLAATGLGLIAFGIYAFAQARYRRIEVSA